QAEADDRRVKKVQMLIAASKIASTRGATDEAIEYLLQALPIAEHGEFRKLLADIYFNLTELSLILIAAKFRRPPATQQRRCGLRVRLATAISFRGSF